MTPRGEISRDTLYPCGLGVEQLSLEDKSGVVEERERAGASEIERVFDCARTHHALVRNRARDVPARTHAR